MNISVCVPFVICLSLAASPRAFATDPDDKINYETARVLYPYKKFWTDIAPLYFVPGAILPIAGKTRKALGRLL